jgi:hypothetical protein
MHKLHSMSVSLLAVALYASPARIGTDPGRAYVELYGFCAP